MYNLTFSTHNQSHFQAWQCTELKGVRRQFDCKILAAFLPGASSLNGYSKPKTGLAYWLMLAHICKTDIRHGYEAATHEAKAKALAMLEAEAIAAASQRFRSQSQSF